MRANKRLMVALGLAVSAAMMLLAAPAHAQDDPYGPTSTTSAPPSGLAPDCHFQLDAALPGATASLTVTSVPFGGTVVVLIGGEEAGRATAPLAGQSVGGGALLGGTALPAQAEATDLVVPLVVPELPPGVYEVTAVGADFSLTCTDGGFDILAGSQGRPSSGSLPFTGVYALLFVLVAVALILIGRVLLRASRARREAKEKAARRARRAARREKQELGSK